MKPWEVARPCVAVASAEVEQRDVYCRLEVPRGGGLRTETPVEIGGTAAAGGVLPARGAPGGGHGTDELVEIEAAPEPPTTDDAGAVSMSSADLVLPGEVAGTSPGPPQLLHSLTG